MADEADNPASYDGVPVWRLPTWPGTTRKMGDLAKVAAYLYFNVEVGGTFSMREIRSGLRSDAEHLNRRLRDLKKQDWDFASYKDQAGQEMSEYVLRKKGKRLWLGEKNEHQSISAAVRREVLERDLNRCVVCGIGAGEPYDGEPDTRARLTIGHRTAGARLGGVSMDNLQAECSRCNEPVNDTPPNPETFGEVMSVVSKLKNTERESLLQWLDSGYRHRNRVDVAYDRVRRLSPSEKTEIAEYLRAATQQK